MADLDRDMLEKRLGALRAFREDLDRWLRSDVRDRDVLRSSINRRLPAAHHAAGRAGMDRTLVVAPPAMIGGLVQKLNVFTNIFAEPYGEPVMAETLDAVEQAIGWYEAVLADPDLMVVRNTEAMDIERAIERALRPSFRGEPPARERDVQDAVENILNATGFSYTRERDTVVVGGRTFIPDFVIERNDLALEVKLARAGHGASEIQEELAADVAAYRTRWARLLFVVYDVGEIANPYAFRMDNMRQLNAPVVIVKH